MIKVSIKVLQASLKAVVLTVGLSGLAQAGPILNVANGHYYEYVAATDNSTYWSTALAAAASQSYMGSQGYLATITSVQEELFVESLLDSIALQSLFADVALGGSDAATVDNWQWVTGPEAGTQFWQGGPSGQAVNGAYSNWEISGSTQRQPDYSGYENYLTMQINSSPPNWVSNTRYMWNNLPGNYALLGYVVEYDAPVGVPTPGPLGLMIGGLGFLFALRMQRRGTSVVRASR